MRRRYQKRHPLAGLMVGAMSGLAGAVMMTQFQNAWNKAPVDMHEPATEPEAKSSEEQDEDSTMKAAGKLSEEIGRPLSREERKKAGPWVHYAFGTSLGAVFGAAAEMKRERVHRINPVLAGAAYGIAVFVAAHEIIVPALKLSSNPLKEPIPKQIAEFVSHLIYGVGTALTYDGLKKLER
jgi:putative membrane protein